MVVLRVEQRLATTTFNRQADLAQNPAAEPDGRLSSLAKCCDVTTMVFSPDTGWGDAAKPEALNINAKITTLNPVFIIAENPPLKPKPRTLPAITQTKSNPTVAALH
jgi:hypothetical protein